MALVEVVYYRLECKIPGRRHCIGWENCGYDFDDSDWGYCDAQGGCMPVPNVLIKHTKMFEFDPPESFDDSMSWYLKIGRKELHSGTAWLESLKIDDEVVFDAKEHWK